VGEDILTFSPSKQYQSIVLSSPELADGASYEVYVGGSSTGTQYTRFTISEIVTMIGNNFRR
jgi:hypothetical protein